MCGETSWISTWLCCFTWDLSLPDLLWVVDKQIDIPTNYSWHCLRFQCWFQISVWSHRCPSRGMWGFLSWSFWTICRQPFLAAAPSPRRTSNWLEESDGVERCKISVHGYYSFVWDSSTFIFVIITRVYYIIYIVSLVVFFLQKITNRVQFWTFKNPYSSISKCLNIFF